MIAKRRTFVVDNESLIAQTLAIILEKSGFTATPFNNPLQALAAAESESFDLLISDVIMPQFSGVNLAIQMKLLHPACNVLLFSGQAQTADLLYAARELGHDFKLLTKPCIPVNSSARSEYRIPLGRLSHVAVAMTSAYPWQSPAQQ